MYKLQMRKLANTSGSAVPFLRLETISRHPWKADIGLLSSVKQAQLSRTVPQSITRWVPKLEDDRRRLCMNIWLEAVTHSGLQGFSNTAIPLGHSSWYTCFWSSVCVLCCVPALCTIEHIGPSPISATYHCTCTKKICAGECIYPLFFQSIAPANDDS